MNLEVKLFEFSCQTVFAVVISSLSSVSVLNILISFILYAHSGLDITDREGEEEVSVSVSVLIDPESQSKYQYQLHCNDQDQDSSYISLNSVQRCIPPFCSTSFSSSSSSTSFSANTTQLSLTSSLNSLVINSDIAASKSLPAKRSPSPLTSGVYDNINMETEREEEEEEGGGGIVKRRKSHNKNEVYLDSRTTENMENNEVEKCDRSSGWEDVSSKNKDQPFQTKSVTRSHQKETVITEKYISLPPAKYSTSTYSAKKNSNNSNHNNDYNYHSAVTSRSGLRSTVLAPTATQNVRKQTGLKNVPNMASQKSDTSKINVCSGTDWAAITASISTSSCDTTVNSTSISSYSSSKRTRSKAVLMAVDDANLE